MALKKSLHGKISKSTQFLKTDVWRFHSEYRRPGSQGNKVVEVRNAGVDKGTAALHFLSKNRFDFVLAVGDDSTDEDSFRVVPETAYSIKIGITQSYARFNLCGSNAPQLAA